MCKQAHIEIYVSIRAYVLDARLALYCSIWMRIRRFASVWYVGVITHGLVVSVVPGVATDVEFLGGWEDLVELPPWAQGGRTLR